MNINFGLSLKIQTNASVGIDFNILFCVFRERAAELEKSWEGLKEATDKKTRGLNEAVEEQQYNRNIGMLLMILLSMRTRKDSDQYALN